MVKSLLRNILKKGGSKERKIKEITKLVNPDKNRCFTKTEATKLYNIYNNNKIKYNNSKKFKSSKYTNNF